MLTAQNDKLDY